MKILGRSKPAAGRVTEFFPIFYYPSRNGTIWGAETLGYLTDKIALPAGSRINKLLLDSSRQEAS